MNLRRLALAAILVSVAPCAIAEDVYVIQGYALGPMLDNANLVTWSTTAYFYNRALTAGTVTLRGISNSLVGGEVPVGDTFSIPPRRSVSLEKVRSWTSRDGDPEWVLHLDVSPGVLVDDAMFIGYVAVYGPPVPVRYGNGKVRLPVFHALVPAGQEQIHLATSLGPSTNATPPIFDFPNRINVTIYNGAGVAATATIEIRQHCDDRVIASRGVTIPADSIVRFGGFDARTIDCVDEPGVGDGHGFAYTVVSVNQPSFSYISNIANDSQPRATVSITADPH